jgi:GH24 family phage-related lysozyme (muramidase)
MSDTFLDQACRLIAHHESFRGRPYDDHDGKDVRAPIGKLTIGYGFNVQDTPLPHNVAIYWLRELVVEMHDEMRQLMWFARANDARQIAFLDMRYNLGERGIGQFHNMIAAARAGEWDQAAAEAKDSLWFRQVKRRGENIVAILANGRIDWHMLK